MAKQYLSTRIMSSVGWDAGKFIAISALAIKVYSAYQGAPGGGYGHISEEVAALRILIDKAAQHFKSALISDHRHYGQKVLNGCQSVLEDLNSLIEKRSTKKRKGHIFTGFKVGKEDIVTLRERLISNTVLLNGFVQKCVVPNILLYRPYIVVNISIISCGYLEIQAQLATILGLYHTSSRISITSIASFATHTNTVEAYKEFCENLSQIGVTDEIIQQKENDILDVLKSQGVVSSTIRDQGQFLGASCPMQKPF